MPKKIKMKNHLDWVGWDFDEDIKGKESGFIICSVCLEEGKEVFMVYTGRVMKYTKSKPYKRYEMRCLIHKEEFCSPAKIGDTLV